MADLIAQGGRSEERWRRRLPLGEPILLGRSAGDWSVPWDMQISRRHAELFWDGGRLRVRKLPEARNPIFFHGRQVAECQLLPKEHFIIGRTSFLLVEQACHLEGDLPQPIHEHQYSSAELAAVPLRNPDRRMEVLSRLPEVLSEATSEEDMCVRLVGMLLAGLPRAEAAAVAVLAETSPSDPVEESGRGASRPSQTEILSATLPTSFSDAALQAIYWDQRAVSSAPFRPSRRLIQEAVRRRRSVLHLWRAEGKQTDALFTESLPYDWAFCTPILSESLSPWVIYLAGQSSVAGLADQQPPALELREEIKFTELVASMVGSLRRMRRLERQQAILRQFFSPLVLKRIGTQETPDLLGPQEAEVTVLFCDLRGFSRHSEKQRENLRELLDRVSQALSVMTRHILAEGGVIGDYQGDAALGFWGWPVAWADMVQRTCRAALAIRTEFQRAAQNPESPLAGFQVGIGIAAGRAVAGKIGPPEQAKVTVFGPVVNLASRLESMTKIFHAPILVDPAMAEAVRQNVPPTVARLRRVAVVRPYGMEQAMVISELLPPAEKCPLLSDEQINLYEAALDAFLTGRWQEAYHYLHQLPADDQVTDFLTAWIAQHNRIPPPQWDGIIPLPSK